jgi:DNA-binding transcriptional regulator GbsR (MarR family)
MGRQELIKIQQLSTFVGQFIRYWGFRKIHGEIWTIVYLSKTALSGSEIVTQLKVSKALVSPALKELELEGLIKQVESENSKTKRYAAEENVSKIIQGVLKRREQPMIGKIQKSHQELIETDNIKELLNYDRLKKMGIMIQLAELSLQTLIEQDFLEN